VVRAVGLRDLDECEPVRKKIGVKQGNEPIIRAWKTGPEIHEGARRTRWERTPSRGQATFKDEEEPGESRLRRNEGSEKSP